jgi:two-component system, NtrC family, sensor kinase
MRMTRLLSFKLFLLMVIILTISSFVVSYFQLQSQSENNLQVITDCGERTSLLIKASTKHSMLLNQKETTHNIIRSIAAEKKIDNIRIYNKQGMIIFSAFDKEINHTVDMQNEACFMCHTNNGDAIEEPDTKEKRRIYTRQDGTRILGFVSAIRNEKSCYEADCHFHPKGKVVLGTIDVMMSLETNDKLLMNERSKMIQTNAAITLLVALLVGAFIWIFVHGPVHRLIIGTKEISSGNLDYKIKSVSSNEIGTLAKSFNQMTSDLAKAKNEITDWSNELEERVKRKAELLKKTQDRIVQIEKMASLGKLSATVAHELNNPMSGILTYSKLIQKKLNKRNPSPIEKDSIINHLKMIETESERCGAIIKNMLLFSKEQKPEFKPSDINTVLGTSLDLIKHHLQLHSIDLKTQLQPNLPEVYIDEHQIRQALLDLLMNAIEAMENDGILTVNSNYNSMENRIFISINDNGKGIPIDIQKQIFEPYFTTKHEVKGVGLGLFVVYGIIQNHNGDISIKSELNKGTTFIIKLPVGQKQVNKNEQK